MRSVLYFLLCVLLLPGLAQAQDCTARGQNPATAFPVCGTTVFNQTTVPLCSTHDLKVPGCDGDRAGYSDRNPFWYKFTCYQSGSLGFLITPKNLGDDYDWQLYDITGRNPNDVFTDVSLIVTGNWSGTFGKTGASNSGLAFIQCASIPEENKNSFAKMPQLKEGHTYLLMVSHFTDSQSGYDLSFGGGTAVITDKTIPHLKNIETNCDNDQLGIKLGKGIMCNSIAADGSDFILSGTTVNVVQSSGFNCSTKFDSDSVMLQLSAPLPPGTYTLGVKKGSDGNSLLDFCENEVPTSDVLTITIEPKRPTPMDSLAPVACAPQELRLIFQKPISCTSVAANGSDFQVVGAYPVQVVSAAGDCANGLSKEIILTLDKPLDQAGAFRVVLQRGTDGNAISDECGLETPVGSNVAFAVKDTVNADFAFALRYGCQRDTIAVSHNGAHGVLRWNWNLDDNQYSTQASTLGIYTRFTEKDISLIVSNGFCSDTASTTVLLDNYLKADFTVFADNCPNEPVAFTSTAVGKIKSHFWDFADGSSATEPAPTHTYQMPDRQRTFNIKYTVTDSLGCTSTATKPIIVYPNCYLAVPTAFTPNNDGLNDYLAPLNAVKATNLEFRIYNRWGQLLYKSSNWKQGWDGTFKGQPQPSATYVWMLQYINRDTGTSQVLRGTAVLIR